jgi:hypothetical protein
LSLLANPLSTVWRFFRGNGVAKADTQRSIDPGTRTSTYDLNAALYDNTLYQAYRDWVLTSFFPRATRKTRASSGHFSPFKEIVDLYVSNVLPGVWGNGVEIDPMVDGKPVNPRLAEPVRRIWRDSNLDSLKSVIVRYAANLGTVGLRVTRTPESIPGDLSTSRVRIQEDHPSRLFNIEEDGQGNVTAVVLKYDEQRNFGTLAEPITRRSKSSRRSPATSSARSSAARKRSRASSAATATGSVPTSSPGTRTTARSSAIGPTRAARPSSTRSTSASASTTAASAGICSRNGSWPHLATSRRH